MSRDALLEALSAAEAAMPRILELATQEERAAVVAWLQRMASNARHWGGEENERAEIYDRLVDVFECGEHRREEKE